VSGLSHPLGDFKATKPHVPCAACGKLLYGGPSSLPPGERMCRGCRDWTSPPRFCDIPTCERKHLAKGLCKKHYSALQKRLHPSPTAPPIVLLDCLASLYGSASLHLPPEGALAWKECLLTRIRRADGPTGETVEVHERQAVAGRTWRWCQRSISISRSGPWKHPVGSLAGGE